MDGETVSGKHAKMGASDHDVVWREEKVVGPTMGAVI